MLWVRRERGGGGTTRGQGTVGGGQVQDIHLAMCVCACVCVCVCVCVCECV
jgi:hypothetical protein